MLELNDSVEAYLEWADRMAAFYESHDEFGVSIKPEDCYGCHETDQPDDKIDTTDYM